ncbi:hypothetical protein [Allorhodopirellula heiligendammensis]|uniref:hypothetical protein n=1 Tax=Allorhodopirellula heiligendammensis TaxID=2714739 RepID=UPI00265F684D|nr:hypothetical protein [Allorhodopirellula heiligendammensis]
MTIHHAFMVMDAAILGRMGPESRPSLNARDWEHRPKPRLLAPKAPGLNSEPSEANR